jgi:cyclophilin family peptidyl-prolyl cis-trans isomerase
MRKLCVMGIIMMLSVKLWALASNPVGPIPDSVRQKCKQSDFYQQGASVHGLPIVASSRVSPYALKEAAWILNRLLAKRPDILQTMAQRGAFVTVMAHNEYTTDVPEHAHLKPRVYWDRRARGLGGVPVSCGEENLLCFTNDPYAQENLLIHEFAHGMHSQALRQLYPEFQARLEAAYKQAKQDGRWEETYAITNPAEYWAEAVQSWCDDNRENDAQHNHVNTRAELKAYDPLLAKLCAEVLGDGPWRYSKPQQRKPADQAHLAGYDFTQSPSFQWRKEPLTDKPVVRIRTSIGAIELELYTKQAPNTVANFIRYVHDGYYKNGHFFRAVRSGNQPDDPVKIAVIQAQADPNRTPDSFSPIQLERTRDTSLKHLDGTISMARMGPDTATHHFFICIGDQPELDFAGKRNPDGQGFAAFGKVIKGMDIVRRIHQLPADKQQLKPPVGIQRVTRLH